MKRKLLLIALCLLALTACGAEEQAQEVQPEAPPQVADESTTTAPDDDMTLDLVEYGYSVSSNQYLYCSVFMSNPSKDFCIKYPAYRVTARDADGIVMGTRDITNSIIYPQQEMHDADQAFKVDGDPATVEVEVLPPADYQIVAPDQVEHDTFVPLSAVNCVVRDGSVMGEISNDNDYEIDKAKVVVMFRDDSGELLGGDYTLINHIAAGATSPFSLSVKDKSTITETFEVYANPL